MTSVKRPFVSPLKFLLLILLTYQLDLTSSSFTLEKSLIKNVDKIITKVDQLQAKITSGKVFIIGGALGDNTASIFNALKEATGKLVPKIAVAISAAPSLSDGEDAYYIPEEGSNSYEQLFKDYGFEPYLIQLAIDNYETANSNQSDLGLANIEIVKNADVVFFNGGDQSRHSRAWLRDDGTDSEIMMSLRDRFDSGLVVAGTSAGAAAVSSPTYGGGYSYGYYYFNADLKSCDIGELLEDDRDGTHSFRYEENGAFMTGFDFISDALVDTHFDARGRFGRLSVAMKATNKTLGFGIGEDTALYINGETDTATAYGNDGVWIIDSSSAVFPSEEYFAAISLKISYLTEGDSYTFSSNEVTSTKPLITSNSGSAYQSDDIFKSDEGIKSIKSLVSSSSQQTVGYSYETKPTARVVFYRNEGEKAYISGTKYTIDKMRMDFGTL